MSARYSDEEIKNLIREKKTLPADYNSRLKMRAKRRHNESGLDITGIEGNNFKLILRESHINPLDFSIILAFCPSNTNITFRLRRYNGKSHEYTNKIEKQTFYDFHIHTATERYQELGKEEESFAEITNRFGDFKGALECMFEDCGFETSEKYPLFEET